MCETSPSGTTYTPFQRSFATPRGSTGPVRIRYAMWRLRHKDAVRIHIITATEEKLYFERAVKYPDLHDLGRLLLQGMRPGKYWVGKMRRKC